VNKVPFILLVLLVTAGAAGPAWGQQESPVWQPLPAAGSQPAAADQGPRLPTEELEKILAPIALYPDALLAQMLPAATFPLQIVQAARWLRAKPDMSKLQDQPWDPSVLALCNYPEIIYMMDKDLDWTNALGTAFLEQQEDVMNAIQDLRRQAEASGALKSTPEQTVSTEQGAIIIAPAQPEVIYVPQYNPQVVYVTQPAQTVVVQEGVSTGAVVAASAISFGVGFALGAWLNTDCNWHYHSVVWCQPGHWHGYVHGGAAWGPNRIAAWGPNRAMIAGPNGGAYFGPRGGAVWGHGNGWVRPTPYGRPSYTGRYASYNTANRYNQVNRSSVRAGNTINVNRNNVNIDRGNRTNISTGNRTNISSANRAVAQPATRAGTSSAFGGNSRPFEAQQYSQRGSQSRGMTSAQQLSGSSMQARQYAGAGSARSSSFGDFGSRSQTQSYSSRGSFSRSGGSFSGGGAGRGGFGGGGRGGRR
jgi:hypothetical protein